MKVPMEYLLDFLERVDIPVEDVSIILMSEDEKDTIELLAGDDKYSIYFEVCEDEIASDEENTDANASGDERTNGESYCDEMIDDEMTEDEVASDDTGEKDSVINVYAIVEMIGSNLSNVYKVSVDDNFYCEKVAFQYCDERGKVQVINHFFDPHKKMHVYIDGYAVTIEMIWPGVVDSMLLEIGKRLLNLNEDSLKASFFENSILFEVDVEEKREMLGKVTDILQLDDQEEKEMLGELVDSFYNWYGSPVSYLVEVKSESLYIRFEFCEEIKSVLIANMKPTKVGDEIECRNESAIILTDEMCFFEKTDIAKVFFAADMPPLYLSNITMPKSAVEDIVNEAREMKSRLETFIHS